MRNAGSGLSINRVSADSARRDTVINPWSKKWVRRRSRQGQTREEAGEGKKAWSVMGSWTLNAGPTCRSIAPIEFADLCVAIIGP